MSSVTVHPENDFSIEESRFQSKHSTSRLSKCLIILALMCGTLLVLLSIIIIPIALVSKGKQVTMIEVNEATTIKLTTTSTSRTENMKETTYLRKNTSPSNYKTEFMTGVSRINTAHRSFFSSYITSQSSLFDQKSTSSNVFLDNSNPSSAVSTTSRITTSNSSTKLVTLNYANDTMFYVYNTTAGQITNDFYWMNMSHNYSLQHAMDNATSTSYFIDSSIDGINSGFIVIPSIYNTTIACAIRFATGNRTSAYDPLRLTLEGSKDTDIDVLLYNNTWMLIYNGSTGINATSPPPRQSFGTQQTFNNTYWFASYRLLITEKRENQTGPIEYSEAHIIGYFP